MLLPSIFNKTFQDDFFDDFFSMPERPHHFMPNVVSTMKTDIQEFDDRYKMDLELPGYGKDDVKVSLKEGYLTIAAEKSESKDEKDSDGKYLRRERSYGSMQRSFYVGDDVTENDIKAKFKDGILSVEVPKNKELPKTEEVKYISIEG